MKEAEQGKAEWKEESGSEGKGEMLIQSCLINLKGTYLEMKNISS
jgi:hypothetical protein